ncbi:hypothetical protein WN66_03192 [Saccharomyces cerevisiae]|uniref:EC1118_1I12_1189p n=1 Tax=Saccharomyces cerevisiae (strain Lalvin EC1118 / Prise de mousse) TaxID=643680 RepID=C8ZAH8_YEAS8|nr:hypothetical protein WN66_03192 [Saccharomyces cerevisiae]CAY80441.1 EC1118_1I12_1189p [Saccharomyces cerevisiae EC1118]
MLYVISELFFFLIYRYCFSNSNTNRLIKVGSRSTPLASMLRRYSCNISVACCTIFFLSELLTSFLHFNIPTSKSMRESQYTSRYFCQISNMLSIGSQLRSMKNSITVKFCVISVSLLSLPSSTLTKS